MGMTRRDAIKLGLATGGAWLNPWGNPWNPSQASWADCTIASPKNAFSPQITPFTCPLYIPDRLAPTRTDNDTDYYEIKIQQKSLTVPVDGGKSVFTLPDLWTYGGNVVGPLIRQRGGSRKSGGRQSVIRFVNELPTDQTPEMQRDRSVVIHLHGMNSLPYYDGYATDFIPPNHYKDFAYPNDVAGTLWYHDHTLDKTARNVYRGLAGMYLVHDECELQLKLPQDNFDVPLIIQDKHFDANGCLKPLSTNRNNGFYGDVICINGMPFPYLDVQPRRYRFRLLNASASRSYQLALSQPNLPESAGGTLIVIGNDEGLLNAPVPLTTLYQTLPLGIAERYDIIIDFANYNPGDRVYLRNVGYTGTVDVDNRAHTLMCFRVVVGDRDTTELPERLGNNVYDIPRSRVVRERSFRFAPSGNVWSINGKTWNENRIDANPNLGDVEIWEFTNPGGGWVHPVHPHLVRFRILSRNGLAVPAYQQGWKDVVMVGESQRVRVLAEFCPHEGRYMMHCHNLVHEDFAMMTQFQVGRNINDPHSHPAKPIADLHPIEHPTLPDEFCPIPPGVGCQVSSTAAS